MFQRTATYLPGVDLDQEARGVRVRSDDGNLRPCLEREGGALVLEEHEALRRGAQVQLRRCVRSDILGTLKVPVSSISIIKL